MFKKLRFKHRSGRIDDETILGLGVIGLVALVFVLMFTLGEGGENEKTKNLEAIVNSMSPYYQVKEIQSFEINNNIQYRLILKEMKLNSNGEFEFKDKEKSFQADIGMKMLTSFEEGRIYSLKAEPLLNVKENIKLMPIRIEKPEKK